MASIRFEHSVGPFAVSVHPPKSGCTAISSAPWEDAYRAVDSVMHALHWSPHCLDISLASLSPTIVGVIESLNTLCTARLAGRKPHVHVLA